MTNRRIYACRVVLLMVLLLITLTSLLSGSFIASAAKVRIRYAHWGWVDEKSSIISRCFHPQIQQEKDIEKIRMPEVIYDVEATERNYQRMVDIFDGILQVEKRGAPGFWFAPWDELIRWWGVTEAMMDLVLRPELVHKAMDRLVQAYLHRLDQYEQLNLLSLNNKNTQVGSGGYGYTDELPQPDYDPTHVRAADLWGCATAQIFSEVSPKMHEEFALSRRSPSFLSRNVVTTGIWGIFDPRPSL